MLDFNKLYKENKPKLLRYLNTRTRNSSDAEELTNDVFIKVFNHLKEFDETKSAFNTWVTNITKNVLIDYYRLKGGSNKAKAFKNMVNTDDQMTDEIYQVFQIPDHGIKADSLHDSTIVVENTAKAINCLKGDKKDIAIDFFYNDLSYDEIADKTNLPLGTVKNYIFKIRKQLQSDLKKEYELV